MTAVRTCITAFLAKDGDAEDVVKVNADITNEFSERGIV